MKTSSKIAIAAAAVGVWIYCTKEGVISGIGGMSRDKARKWIENRGYRVVYQMGSYPSPGYYMAIPSGPWGQILRGSLNGIVEEIKRREGRYGY